MYDFEPYDCFDQMTEENSCSLGQQTRIVLTSMMDKKHHAYYEIKKQEKDHTISSCLPQSLSLHHQQRMNRYDNHKCHLQSLQQEDNNDDNDIFLDRLLLQSPLSRCCEYDKRSTRNDQEQEQEETPLQQDQFFFHDAGRFTGHSVSTKTSLEHSDYEQDTQSEEVIARNVTPAFKSKQERKKKRKNHLDPGTHLASTLNFPYKSEAGNADGGYHSKRLKIWNDEADQGRILEKHFNPEWQFQFLNEFYGGEASASSRKNTMKSRTIHNQDDLHHNIHSQKIDESKSSKDSSYNKKKKNEERHVVAKTLDNVLKEASLKLLAAMDLTDISRNKVVRIEEELNFDRKQYIL